jgi:hypothetical protein
VTAFAHVQLTTEHRLFLICPMNRSHMCANGTVSQRTPRRGLRHNGLGAKSFMVNVDFLATAKNFPNILRAPYIA